MTVSPDGARMDVAVRAARADDYPAFAPLFDAYRRFYDQPSDVAGAETFLRERAERGDSCLFGAWWQGALVGFCQCYPGVSSIAMRPTWVLNDLFVLPEARRHGIADALMAAAERAAVAAGAVSMSLQTARSNHAGQALYARRGWKLETQFLSYEWPPA